MRDLTAWLQHTQPEKDTSLPPSQSRASFCSCYLFFAANPLACQEPGSRNVEQAKKVKLLLGLEYSIKGKDKRHYLSFFSERCTVLQIFVHCRRRNTFVTKIYVVLRILVDCRRRNAYVKSNKMFVLRNHVLMRWCIISLSH